MPLVVDASVALKWIIVEPDSPVAREVPRREKRLLVPDFLLNEAANVIWVQVRKGRMDADDARTALPRLTANILVTPTRKLGLHAAALDIALATNHSVYDTLYVAFALAIGAGAVIAADRPFAQAIRRHPDPAVARMVLPLDEWARARGLS